MNNTTTLRLGAAFLGILLALAMLGSVLTAGSILRGTGPTLGDDLSRSALLMRGGTKGTCPICGGRTLVLS